MAERLSVYKRPDLFGIPLVDSAGSLSPHHIFSALGSVRREDLSTLNIGAFFYRGVREDIAFTSPPNMVPGREYEGIPVVKRSLVLGVALSGPDTLKTDDLLACLSWNIGHHSRANVRLEPYYLPTRTQTGIPIRTVQGLMSYLEVGGRTPRPIWILPQKIPAAA